MENRPVVLPEIRDRLAVSSDNCGAIELREELCQNRFQD
jgi:hypothetical protein